MELFISESISTGNIRVGDELSFDYPHAKRNGICRAGYVEGFVGTEAGGNRCVVLWDWTANGYRSFRLSDIRNLSRIRPASQSPLSAYKRALRRFAEIVLFGVDLKRPRD